MYNYFMLIGVVTQNIAVREVLDGKKVVNVPLACRRSFKNMDGGYDTDYFDVSVWEAAAEMASERLRVGSKVVIKGRLAPKKETLQSGATINRYELYGERIIFLDNFTDTEIEG